jgi:hypothetical protein
VDPVRTTKALLTWSADGSTVTKALEPVEATHWRSLLGSPERAFRNEQRVNVLLRRSPPPVRVPRLLATSTRPPTMTFEAVAGEALGPKFPTALPAADVCDLVGLVDRLAPYRPRRRWLRRLDVDRRLRRHRAEGLLDDGQAAALARLASSGGPRLRFAHGDVTARNVLRTSDGELVLIDWEWAGLYPPGYERAFLWLSLVDVPGGRDAVEASVPAADEAGFLLSAVLVQLLHLDLWRRRPPQPFLATHRDTLAGLLSRIS